MLTQPAVSRQLLLPFPSGEKHITAIGPYIPLKMLVSPPWLDLLKNAIFMNVALKQQGNRDGWGSKRDFRRA